MPALAPLPFASSSTPDESWAGFVVVPISVAPFIAIATDGRQGRAAVGGVGYAIVDRDTLRPIETCATLAELCQERALHAPS